MRNALSRSPWGLDIIQPPEPWMTQALCARRDPLLWTDKDLAGMAIHQCRSHCPVLAECKRWSTAPGRRWHGVVVGGLAYIEMAGGKPGASAGHPAKHQSMPVTANCPTCRPLDGPPSLPVPECGTPAAVSRHRRRHEELDDTCKSAEADRKRRRRDALLAELAADREVA